MYLLTSHNCSVGMEGGGGDFGGVAGRGTDGGCTSFPNLAAAWTDGRDWWPGFCPLQEALMTDWQRDHFSECLGNKVDKLGETRHKLKRKHHACTRLRLAFSSYPTQDSVYAV